MEDIAPPTPAPNEVLVRVAASGVGPWDAWLRAGKSVLPQPLPFTLGSDFSGTIIALGSEVRQFESGQEVFGTTNERFTGAYAEYATASAAMIAHKPQSLPHRDAAGLPVVAVTAAQMVEDEANVAAGQRVLVHGAGGSVGALAVQLARLRGATVVGTEKERGASYVRSLGVEQVIDTRAPNFERLVQPVDVIIDTVGEPSQSQLLSMLKPGGILVSSVSQPDPSEASRRGVRSVFVLVRVTSAALSEVANLVEAGKLTSRLGPFLRLSDARLAHEMLEGRVPREPGKIVLAP